MYRGSLIAFLLCVSAACAAYVPGVGIPDPADYWYGIDPVDDSRPSDPVEWPSGANTNFYYVDNTDGDATDTANTYGYPDKPRLTMPTTLVAGATVIVAGGPYAPADYTALRWLGTSNAPIWISGDTSGTNRIEFQNKWRIREGTYLLIENLKFTENDEAQFQISPGANSEEVNHIAVRNCEVVGDGADHGAGTQFSTSIYYDQPAFDLVFYNCLAHDGGDWLSATENDQHSFGLGSYMTNIWWIGCEAYHCGGDGFGNGHSASYTSHELFYDNCVSWECRENAIDLKEVFNVVISGCHFYSFAASSSSVGEAIVTHYGNTGSDYGTYNLFVMNSRIHDSVYGIVTTDVGDAIGETNLWWVGNVVYDCDTALRPDRGGGSVRVWNNTVYNCGYGISVTGAGMTLDVRNNLIVDSPTSYLYVTDSGARSRSTVLNEDYFESGGAISISWVSTYTNVATWNAAQTPIGDNSIEQDPLFLDAAGDNYEIATNSPCIGAGYNIYSTLTNDYYTVFGRELVYADINGTLRPDAAWTIGAYEYDVDTNAPVVTNVVATVTGQTTCTVTWTTDESCPTNTVEYSTDESYGSSETATTGTSHTSYLTSLSSDTTYNFRVISWDYAGNSTTNTPSTFDTFEPPVISGVVATPTAQTTCTVEWDTDRTCSTNVVEYSEDESYGSSEAATDGTNHVAYLTGLTGNTTYNFRVISWEDTGTPSTNTPSTFTTLDAPADPTVTRIQVGQGVTFGQGIELKGNAP